MIIAFEGPDNTGKSTSAANLSSDLTPVYNATKDKHAVVVENVKREAGIVETYDRIDWLSHMVYRLALPEHEWNDDRPRTVFAMPDTHLVFKVHSPNLAALISDELYETGTLALVNPMYYYFSQFFLSLNEERNYALFKTVSIVEVSNNPVEETFSQRMLYFSSPIMKWNDLYKDQSVDDDRLLNLLRNDDQNRL